MRLAFEPRVNESEEWVRYRKRTSRMMRKKWMTIKLQSICDRDRERESEGGPMGT